MIYTATELHIYALHHIFYAKQKHLGCKKARPIRSSSYLTMGVYVHIAILATKNFDIRLRPRIN